MSAELDIGRDSVFPGQAFEVGPVGAFPVQAKPPTALPPRFAAQGLEENILALVVDVEPGDSRDLDDVGTRPGDRLEVGEIDWITNDAGVGQVDRELALGDPEILLGDKRDRAGGPVMLQRLVPAPSL